MVRFAVIAVSTVVLLGALGRLDSGWAQSLSNPLSKIANGLESFDYPSVVVLIDPVSGFQFCTGVLIGCSTVLTAAHCVCNATGPNCQPGGANLLPVNRVGVVMQNDLANGVNSILVPENYVREMVADLAILKLSSPVNGIQPTPINDAVSVPFSTAGTLVGYGVTNEGFSDNGIKRVGEIVTDACPASITDSQHLCWTFPGTANAGPPGTDSNICPGDSGAPLFMDFGAGPRVAGVTSGNLGDCHTADIAFDTDIFVNRAYIQSMGGSDLNNTFCGPLPQAGEAGTTIIPFTGSTDSPRGLVPGRHNFTVPAATEVLRVILNAEEGPVTDRNNFELYVKFGSPPTTTDFDCNPNFIGNFEGCEFNTPQPGEWHVLVTRSQGPGGRYQISATLFGSNTIQLDDFDG